MNSQSNRQDDSGQSLFNLAIKFNFYPVRYAHPSWLQKDENFRVIESLKSDPAAHFSLSAYLLKKFNLQGAFDFDFGRFDKRVVFASAAEIEQLAFYIGLVTNEEVIRSVVRREERSALKQCLGEDAYRFAVKKAQFISRTSVKSGPSILIDWGNLDRFKAYLISTGQSVMASAFSDVPEAFRQRLIMKMPRSWQIPLSKPSDTGLTSPQCISLLLKTHKEVNRQWRHLLS
ncbi:SctK family type III secretion system sorting platform protein [uncultured Endozoicomonas sp.]|uniref:SctK family type III secretion system sorting platform protein n=1 Tax=uncultured Endozoicomonas sp. TaxID=432652 RepID=UPI0026232AA9|nr:SctK family type III secretion system sorting platform protein [uncultured Endozoicomonas sp.]